VASVDERKMTPRLKRFGSINSFTSPTKRKVGSEKTKSWHRKNKKFVVTTRIEELPSTGDNFTGFPMAALLVMLPP
jgi:uncharacterized surface anchored protein